MRGLRWIRAGLGGVAGALTGVLVAGTPGGTGNRLAYLDGADPFHVGVHFPRLTTPQWVGEPGVDVVVTLGIDDMSQSARYEEFLRPILERLKRIDGRAPVSIFSNALNPVDPQLQRWLREGLTFEVHTLSHPCPILAKHDLGAAENTFHGGVDLLNTVPGNLPVAFRTPCCDSINSPSPRLFAEVFARTNSAGQFLRLDSSVLMLLTTNDPALPASELVDAAGRGRFTKYVPFPSFVTTVENYPYPWAIGNVCLEFPCTAPSDWEAQNILGRNSAVLTEDWKKALELIALKQGVFNFVFHPHGWCQSEQLVEFIDFAEQRLGPRVRFLTFREASDRLTRHLGAGQALRAADGSDNGVRLLDLNADGYLDVVIGNEAMRRTRVWDPASRAWKDGDFPVPLVATTPKGTRETGVRFGVFHADGRPALLVRSETHAGLWVWQEGRWVEEADGLRGLELDGEPVMTQAVGRDRGVRWRDVDGDGVCEVLMSNATQNAAFRWHPGRRRWERSPLALPSGVSVVDVQGDDNGLRWVDLNEDGHDDVVFSNSERYGVWLYVPEPFLGWTAGWTRKLMDGVRPPREPADPVPANELPPIVRAGSRRNNGAWFHSGHLWIQNENTAHLKDLVDRRSYADLLRGTISPPQSPEEALKSFRVEPGFRIECVAAEPVVQDPVAFDWDAEGRLWVVEMRDYPLGLDGKGAPGGVVKRLQDDDGDGRWDQAVEFLSGVAFPTAVMPWRNGVLVAAAPEIFHAEDRDGDGRADWRRVLFTGFVEGNQQHRVNGFALGLDGWVYGANGDSGGSIRVDGRVEIRTPTGWRQVSPNPSNAASPISISGRDFRFRPDSLEFESIEGQTQFGRNRDDWGQWFGNANYTWLWQYPLPARYVARNPHLAIRDPRRMLAQHRLGNRVFPVRQSLPRPNVVGDENSVTSACSPTPYRDNRFGPAFADAIFISEPSGSLVHCELLDRTGPGFTSRRLHGDEPREFLASTDPWFRPTQLKTGPDGALYVADMYRWVLEHPEWIPRDMQERMDVRAGEDRGRIYRIVPEGDSGRRIVPLAGLDGDGLVAAMDSPNGWQRDTAMRLLWERNERTAVPALERLATGASLAQVRVQAGATLEGWGALKPEVLLRLLADAEPAVRGAAVPWAEGTLRAPVESAVVLSAVCGLASDPDPRVAFQVALSLGESPARTAGEALATVAVRWGEDPLFQDAILSSAMRHLPTLLATWETSATPVASLVERVIPLASAMGDVPSLERALGMVLRLDPQRDASTRFGALAALQSLGDRVRPEIRRAFDPVWASAREVALNPAAPEPLRLRALNLIGSDVDGAHASNDVLAGLLLPQESRAIQEAALDALVRRPSPSAAAAVSSRWSALSPGLRGRWIQAMSGTPAGARALLAALAAGQISPLELGPTAGQALRTHPDAGIRQQAQALLAAVQSDRPAVVERLKSVALRPGRADRGRETFRTHCAACHELQGEGIGVGPHLGAVLDKTPEALLVAILDPNRAVEDRYLGYTARTVSGQEFTGLIAAESANSLTLRSANGVEAVFLRSELESLEGTRRSLMPEGFEHSLEADEWPDLIAFLTASRPEPKSFAGNRPVTVRPDSMGVLRLRATMAEIHGDSLVFEPAYGNLGYWQSANDTAVWTLDVQRGEEFEVWLDWARPGGAGEAPARMELQVGEMRLKVSVPPTGSWDEYRQEAVGRIRLEGGTIRLSMRAVPPLSGAVLDLREVRLVPR